MLRCHVSASWYSGVLLRRRSGVVVLHRVRGHRRKNPKNPGGRVGLEEHCCVAVSFCLVRLDATSVAPWLSRCTSPGTWTRVEMLMDRVSPCRTKGCAGAGCCDRTR
jgi:hypothetical protein